MTPALIEALLPQQRALLDGLVPLLAPDGRLVYATCTMHPAENAAQVEALLKREQGIQLTEQFQCWPDTSNGGDGFYAAVLQRL